jgi:predicted nucleotidyltransferase component of viral defense system
MKVDLLNRAQLSIINKNNFRYPLSIAEKDYMLGIVLGILYESSVRDKLVFKGGSALHHLYLNQLRFSEDLDFTVLGKITLDEVKEILGNYEFLKVKEEFVSRFTIKIGKLQYQGPLGLANWIKLNFDLAGNVFKKPIWREHKNIFGLQLKVLSMGVEEIVAEKIRAIFERARYRDFYDLTMTFKKYQLYKMSIYKILQTKELKRDLNREDIISNWEVAKEGKRKDSERIWYREEIGEDEIDTFLESLFVSLKL